MNALRALASRSGTLVQSLRGRAASRDWPPYSRLLVVGDGAGWSLDRDAGHLEETARRLGLHVAPAGKDESQANKGQRS